MEKYVQQQQNEWLWLDRTLVLLQASSLANECVICSPLSVNTFNYFWQIVLVSAFVNMLTN